MEDILQTLRTQGINMSGRKSEGGIFRFDQHLENNIFQFIHHSTSRDSFLVYLVKQKKIAFRKQERQLASFFWGLLAYLGREDEHQAGFYWTLLLNHLPRHVLLRVYKLLEEIFFRSGLKRKMKNFFLAERAEVQVRSVLGLSPQERDLWTAEVEGRLVPLSWIRKFVLQVEARRHLKKKGGKRLKLFREKKADVRLAYKADRLQKNPDSLNVELSLLRVGQFANDEDEKSKAEISPNDSFSFFDRESKGERAFGGQERVAENPGVFGANTLKEPFLQETMRLDLGEAIMMGNGDEDEQNRSTRNNLKRIYEQAEEQRKPTRRAFQSKKKKRKIMTCFRFDFRPTKKKTSEPLTIQKHTAKELIALDLIKVDTSKTNTKLIRKKSKSARKKKGIEAPAMLPGKAQYLKNKQKRLIEMALKGTDEHRQFLRKNRMSKKRKEGDFTIDYAAGKRFNEKEVRGKSPVKRRFSPANQGVYRNHLQILKSLRK